MPCDPFYMTGNRAYGYACSRGRGGKKNPPCSCGAEGTLQCDGPTGDPAKTCDRYICRRCAVSLRVHDVDLCPNCARGPSGSLLPCLLANLGPAVAGSPVRCMGARIERLELCVLHAVLFDHWHAFEGGEKVYGRGDLSREQKRDEHRHWLRSALPDHVTKVLQVRHVLERQSA